MGGAQEVQAITGGQEGTTGLTKGVGLHWGMGFLESGGGRGAAFFSGWEGLDLREGQLVWLGKGPTRCWRFGVMNARMVKTKWRKRDPTYHTVQTPAGPSWRKSDKQFVAFPPQTWRKSDFCWQKKIYAHGGQSAPLAIRAQKGCRFAEVSADQWICPGIILLHRVGWSHSK